MSDEDLLTLPEAAELTGRPHSVLHGWTESGRLPAAGHKTARSGAQVTAYRRADALRLHAERPRQPPRREPTEAELNALIAEQMANLPPWWAAEAKAARKLNVAAVVARGLAEARARRAR